MTIWLLIEEAETGSFADETGSFADGNTYCVLSAHKTEKGADDARDAWRKSHGEPPHPFISEGDTDEDEDLSDENWCDCESGVTVVSVEVVD